MIAETKKGGVLTPEAGKYMYNEKEGVVSDRVYLGIEDDGSDWREITEAEKIAIEAALSARGVFSDEVPTDETD